MPEHDGVVDYLSVAEMRLADARELLAPPTVDSGDPNAPTRHLRAAMYLAGYALECTLKAYIVTSEGARGFFEVVAKYKESADLWKKVAADAHDVKLLLAASRLPADPTVWDEPRRRLWGQCEWWNVAIRYHPKPHTDVSSARGLVAVLEEMCQFINDERRKRSN